MLSVGLLRQAVLRSFDRPSGGPVLHLLLLRRGLRSRGVRGRGQPHSAQVLLDRFVKRVSVDGGLTVSAPFALKVRGTYFDDERNVDGRRNRAAREELYLARQFPPTVSTVAGEAEETSDSDSDQSSSGDEDPSADDRNIFVNMLKTSDRASSVEEALLRNARQDENGTLSRDPSTCALLGGSALPASSVFPLHLLVYGRNYHRLDSYSVMHPQGDSHCSHVHVSDAVSFTSTGTSGSGSMSEDDDALFLHQHYRPGGSLHGLRPCGGAAVWLPHRLRTVFPDMGADINRDGDKMVSEVKFYLPQHILEAQEHGVRGVLLVPTSLARMSLKTERDSSLELDGQLQNNLAHVHLITEGGDIKTRDVYASREIRMTSRSGDIMCEGVTNGHVVAETREDGDFLARDVEGPQVTVTTDAGDINVWGDCSSDLSQFFTRVGNVHVRYLYGNSYILVRESGTVNANLVEGSLTCVVKRGTINASVESIVSDSTIQVSDGEITVALPPKPPFRVTISATTTNIAPQLLNSGDFYKRFDEDASASASATSERENFNTGPYQSASKGEGADQSSSSEELVNNCGADNPRAPVLNIVANRGSVTVVIKEETRKSGGGDSAHNNET